MRLSKIFAVLSLVWICLPASAQFRRSSDGGIYPYNTNLIGSDVFIIGRPGVTNYNYAYSNLSRINMTNSVIVTSNLYATNIYVTNLFATFTSNTYVTNIQAGSIYTTNLYTTNLYSSNIFTTNLYTTNAYITNLFAGNTYTTNLYTTNVFANTTYTSNAYITNLFSTNAYITNLFSTTQVTSNLYTTNLITTNFFAGDTYISNAYITNLTVNNLAGLTNNTARAGIVVGSGIGSNLTAYARLDAANIFTDTNTFPNAGVTGILGVSTATATTLDVTGPIHTVFTNVFIAANANGFLTGTGAISVANFTGPTNTAIVGQVLHATSTAGASKWDYVNQVGTNVATGSNANFNLPYSRFTIATTFLWASPANVDTTLTRLQVTDVAVTNSTAAAVVVTFAASVKVTGTPYVTNVTYFHWRVDPWLTNCLCEPVF